MRVVSFRQQAGDARDVFNLEFAQHLGAGPDSVWRIRLRIKVGQQRIEMLSIELDHFLPRGVAKKQVSQESLDL